MPAGDPDAALVQALRTAHPGAAEALVNAYGDRLYRLAVRITGSTEDAADAVRTALATVMDKIHALADHATLDSWLYWMTASAAHLKLTARRMPPGDIPWDEVSSAPDRHNSLLEPVSDWSTRLEDAAHQEGLGAVVEAALAVLPPDHRTAFVLHDLEGRSTPEIAEVLGIARPAVMPLVHRSRLVLRHQLTRHLSAPPPDSAR
jgi:RNA polymerase sigma-70 factor (ECF subfamily)